MLYSPKLKDIGFRTELQEAVRDLVDAWKTEYNVPAGVSFLLVCTCVGIDGM